MTLSCKYCVKLWTAECPIRVWGRNEGNENRLDNDVNIETDFCSRFVADFKCEFKFKGE